jgi:uncharacterized protein involved in exopolysaccharide biosynthesis
VSRALLYLGVLWSHRRLIVLQTLAVMVVTAVVVLLLPSWYRSRTETLPPSETEGGVSLASLLAGVKVPGIEVPGTTTQNDLYIAILRSRWVGERVVRQFKLMDVYHAKTMEDAVKLLHKHSTFGETDEGTLVVTVEDKNRERSAALANAFITYLDLFNREHRTTRGKAMRMFVERRLAETGDSLRLAEETLTAYQQLHKGAALAPDVAGAAEASARLIAERMSLAVNLDALRAAMSATSPQVQEARTQLAALDRQLARLPGVGLELARHYRRVKIQEQLYALLTAQYEEARINEARDTPTVDVLDLATPPSRRSRPRRTTTVLTAGALAAVWGVVLSFGLEALRRHRQW